MGGVCGEEATVGRAHGKEAPVSRVLPPVAGCIVMAGLVASMIQRFKDSKMIYLPYEYSLMIQIHIDT